MGIIKIYQGKSKPTKHKPGWREDAAAEAAWLRGLQAMTVTNRRAGRLPSSFKPIQVVVNAPVVAADRLNRPPSLITPGGAGTKPVARPDILYKDAPDMLSRELVARQRKFNVAPAYNKGAAQYVSEDEITTQLIGARRR